MFVMVGVYNTSTNTRPRSGKIKFNLCWQESWNYYWTWKIATNL